jgi:3-oxoacyl-[acyl-carrier-protein] synthase-1
MERQGKGVALLGVGESSDAYHMSTPHPSGQGIALAIRNSLGNAAVLPTEITYVNLHGTGTLLNDQGEGKAIAETLGTTVPVSSTKAMTGHLLGAAGSTEAGFCYLIVQSRKSFEQDRDMIKLPPHCWDGHLDPLIPPLHFVGKESRISRPIRLICLSVSAAFGGSNCALLFGETEG